MPEVRTHTYMEEQSALALHSTVACPMGHLCPDDITGGMQGLAAPEL